MAIFDNLWENSAIPTRRSPLKALPQFRDTKWRPKQPHEWPDLSRCILISHDIERREDDFSNGPGWARGEAHTCGHSLTGYWRDGNVATMYLPTRHEVDAHMNLPEDKVIQYVRDSLQTPYVPKLYANGIYDVGSSTDDNIYVMGQLHDVQFAEALIDENALVNLDSLAEKYLKQHKLTNELYEWCAAAYGGEPTSGQRENIYRASPLLAGPYAEQDTALLAPVLFNQMRLLDALGLMNLYEVECKLIRILVRMRMQGVRIDLPYIEELRRTIDTKIIEAMAKFHAISGVMPSESCSTGDVALAFDKLGIKYRITPKTQKPSITKEDLKLIPHEIAVCAIELRELFKMKSQFIDSTLLAKHKDGIVHGSFNPLKSDEKGAKSGRFSSDNPNLQNIPARTELGKLVRKAFVPFFGHAEWRKADYSQFEYRILASIAVDNLTEPGSKIYSFGPGPYSNALRQSYIENPKMDYHQRTMDMIKKETGKELPRKPVKTINFGLMNLMGEELLAFNLSLSRKDVAPLLEAYHAGNPYVKATAKFFELCAMRDGFIRTIGGRYARFDMWEPKPRWDDESKSFIKYPAMPLYRAQLEYGSNIQRARCHTALNRRTQGDNADGIKFAIVALDEAGFLDYIGMPTLTVHDELDWSVIDLTPSRLKAHDEAERLMERCLPSLGVPLIVEHGRGANWGVIE